MTPKKPNNKQTLTKKIRAFLLMCFKKPSKVERLRSMRKFLLESDLVSLDIVNLDSCSHKLYMIDAANLTRIVSL